MRDFIQGGAIGGMASASTDSFIVWVLFVICGIALIWTLENPDKPAGETP